MKALLAAEGSPLDRRGETIAARAVPSWAAVRFLAVSPDMVDRLPSQLAPARDDAKMFASTIDVIVVPWLSPGTAVPLDAEMCPVAPPGEWRGKPPAPCRPQLVPPPGVGVLEDDQEPFFKP